MKVFSIALVVMTGAAVVTGAADVYAKEHTKRHKGVLDARTMARPNAPANGGSCGTPTAFSGSPYSDSGNTTGAAEIIDEIADGCSDYSFVEGPEVVYSFVPGSGANLTFTVTPTNKDYDPAIYIVSSCTNGDTCVSGADAYYSGAPESFSVSTLAAGTTYYLHVDAYYPTSDSYYGYTASGPYNLNVTGTFPVQLQEFKID